MEIHKFFLFSLCTSIIFCGISVSASQFFLFLSFLFILFDRKNLKVKINPILITVIFLFFTYFLSAVYHLWIDSSYIKKIPSSELKDIFLFLGFFVFYGLKNEDIPKIEKAFRVLIYVLVITGLISAFSPIRLSRLFNDLFRVSTAWKFTHHYGDVMGIGIHLPIGLMNTHLTFGGLLMLFFPGIFYKFILSIKSKQKDNLNLLMLILLVFIFFLNNARSAMGGAAIALAFGFLDIVFVKKIFEFKTVIKLLLVPLVSLVLLTGILFSNETTKQFIAPLLGEEKHTDSGRTFIWNSTFPMIKENPFLGIGPGNYLKEVDTVRKNLATKEEELSYFYEVTQRGHSHNDYLHLATIAGTFSVLAYLVLAGLISTSILDKKLEIDYSVRFYGLVGFFFAGLYQCYFQDDEVVVVFWMLLGFLVRLKRRWFTDDANMINISKWKEFIGYF
ncbi:MAG: O-antigen ligase family protein [Leptospiraceae bacterium]|nr:O-antigen ligase family protein [Leptospiraceae bacterium]MCP5497999.1 O-antigen ligase family protein [Leptospiraceae bacterium]